jgi:hypothetical protein
MAYGHAERNLAAIRQLEAETRELLSGSSQPDPEQLRWLQETAGAGPQQACRQNAATALSTSRQGTNGPGR